MVRDAGFESKSAILVNSSKLILRPWLLLYMRAREFFLTHG